ncbi:Aspartyl protease family protein 2 [Sesamum angolense]|uniref:Aspartyl protease family protein 2 n=1 Tax=Sesamum angolense TaxID=2727404 RepID=A0AAE2C4U2_9LAMI|nr:Aspartyl protease family protein 2 [Sesamum angolense]
MASPSSHLLFLVLLCSIPSSYLTASTIPVSVFNTIPHSDPFQRLSHLAFTSIARARHIKNAQNAPTSTTHLFPYSGAYSISLSFGTPPQSIPMLLDTGSSFSWFPCTKRYVCRHCSVSSTGISSFIPKESSSAKILGCMNPKCGWVHQSFDPNTSCQECQLQKTNCTQICPPYIILYGLGSTGGIPMVETLNMPHKKISDFLVGCSLFSSGQPAGVAGFGKGVSSLPSQLGIKKFSYCLVSHKFDNTPKSGFLSMDPESDSNKKTGNLSYTPMLKNPVRAGTSALSDYYYVGLRRITVGGQKVKVSYQQLSPDSDGNGGTIVDSGSTFTYMNQAVFDMVSNAFSEQVKEYKRAETMESQTGLRPCFDVTGHDAVKMPALTLHFKGGAEMALPLENYFFAVDDVQKEVVCLSMVTDNTLLGPELISGPSVILGNFLMQNFHVEYDLTNERFGFRQQSCS